MQRVIKSSAGQKKRQENTTRETPSKSIWYRLSWYWQSSISMIVTDITLYDVCTWPFMFTGSFILEFAFIETTSDTEIWKIYVSREPCILRWIVRREFVIERLNNMQNHSSRCKAVRYYSLNMFIHARAELVHTYVLPAFITLHLNPRITIAYLRSL